MFAALAQPVILGCPTLMAATWFGEDERGLANTLASLANPIGIAAGSVVPPLLFTCLTPSATVTTAPLPTNSQDTTHWLPTNHTPAHNGTGTCDTSFDGKAGMATVMLVMAIPSTVGALLAILASKGTVK